MPSKNTVSQKTFVEGNYTYYSQYRSCSSQWVIKNGKPDLSVQNPHNYVSEQLVKRVKGWSTECTPGGVPHLVAPFMGPSTFFDPIEQIALAKFNGKLRKGSASLGVTAGSWGQSHSMIAGRLSQVNNLLRNGEVLLRRDPKRLRKIRKHKDPLANLVLETEFGWRPLVQDLQSAFRVIAGDTIPPVWIRGSQKVNQSENRVIQGSGTGVRRDTYEFWSGDARVTVAASCSVSNPNAFLLNHLGVLNPLGVLWDLIPWSFVVGMFVNVNAMISSLTNEVGLSITNKSVTKSCHTTYDSRLHLVNGPRTNLTILDKGSIIFNHVYRTRSVGALPPVKWQVHVPELNPEQLLIAAALVLQRFQRINRLIGL